MSYTTRTFGLDYVSYEKLNIFALKRYTLAAISWSWFVFVIIFIYAPILVVVAASFDPGRFVHGRAFLQFPPEGFTLHWYFTINNTLWESLLFSLQLAGTVAIVAVILGVPAAVALVRGNFPGRNVVAAFLRMPLQIPSIVLAVGFLQAYFLMAAYLGFSPQGHFYGLVLPHFFAATPFVISSTGATLQRIPETIEAAARTLGCRPVKAFFSVTLPLLAPGIFGGALFAFVTSFTDVTLSLFLAPPSRTTFPVWVFVSMQQDLEPTVPALSSLVFVGSIIILIIAQRKIGMRAVLQINGRY